MTYEKFKHMLIKRMEQLLPPNTSLHLQTICKNNGLKLDGLTISNHTSNISPTIFLNYYYDKQNLFSDFDAICQDILLTYEQNKSSDLINIEFFTNFELAKEHLAYRIINFEKNKELLETVPYIRYLDLAIVFYCLLNFSEKGNATILIHTNHTKLWHVTADELYQHTCQTTPNLLPYDFQNMSKVLSDVFDTDNSTEQELTQDADFFCPMYVLTNTYKLYGASCMLYPDLLAHISEILSSDLFILPSSIHEIIILPAAGRSHYKDLTDMVAEINRTELSPDEVLSDHVYYYSKTEQALSLC